MQDSKILIREVADICDRKSIMSKKKIEKPDIFVISFMTNVTSFQEASIKNNDGIFDYFVVSRHLKDNVKSQF
jgi:hypothetical protein